MDKEEYELRLLKIGADLGSGNYTKFEDYFATSNPSTEDEEYDQLALEYGMLDHNMTTDMRRLAEIKPRYQELCEKYTGHTWDDNFVACIECGAGNPQ